jgi:intracellular sulfur oxidation DsrE/DsrF family protein
MLGMFPRVLTAMRLALPLACGVAMTSGHAQTDLVYVSGQGFPAADTLRQALADNQRKPHEHFWVVITGADATMLTKGRAGAEILSVVRRVHERGGFVYVCDSDLAAHRISEDELLEGVARVSGYQSSAQTELPTVKEGLVLPESVRERRLIWKACADE